MLQKNISLKNSRFLLLLFGFILIFSVFFFFSCSTAAESKPEISVLFLDVGQGDATLVTLPNNVRILIDTGDGANPHSDRDAGRDIIAPFLKSIGTDYIDYLILTHPHRDHVGGTLQFLYQINVGEILYSGEPGTARYYEELLRYIQRTNIPIRKVTRGETLDFEDIQNLHIEFLHPDNVSKYSNINNKSVVTYIKYGDVTFFIAADAEIEAEESIVSHYPDLTAQILRTGHHGSSTSTSQTLLNALKPEVAIISCAENNRFNHPSRQVLHRLERQRIDIYKTYVHGHIEVLSDGNDYRIDTQR